MKLNFGARTCSINKLAEIAFSVSFTASVTESSEASTSAIKLVNLACVLFFNLPVNLSQPTAKIKAKIGIRVCQSLFRSLFGFFW